MATVTVRPFVLTGADGGPLRGDVRTAGRGEGRPAVVVCHGFKGFKDWGFFPHLAMRLARAGMTAVTFNFSGSGIGPDGESFSEIERFAHSTFSNDLDDLETVRRALAHGDLVGGLGAQERIGLFGHSRGGGVAVLHASAHASCAALVTWAAIAHPLRWDGETLSRWKREGKIDIVNQRTGDVLPLRTDILDDIDRRGDELDIAQAAKHVSAPWLIVHGAADEAVPHVEAERLLNAAQTQPCELKVIADGTHTFGARHPWAGSTPWLDEAMDATVDWYSRHLL
jgi:dienelactone hydrolase